VVVAAIGDIALAQDAAIAIEGVRAQAPAGPRGSAAMAPSRSIFGSSAWAHAEHETSSRLTRSDVQHVPARLYVAVPTHLSKPETGRRP
jgi:hypothetical protein